MDAGNAEIEALKGLLALSKELITLDVRVDSYTERLEAYCEAVDSHLRMVPRGLAGPGLEIVPSSALLNEMMQELVENHRLVLERAVFAKEGVAADLAKLRRTKRGMIAYLSQSFDKKESR